MRDMETAKVTISSQKIKESKLTPINDNFLKTQDIVIYTIYLTEFYDLQSELLKSLNEKEIKKARRFYKDIDKKQFITYRAILKYILAAYAKIDVKNIHFGVSLNNKPFLISHPWLHFNISHSKDFAVIAISLKKVGIDIEYMSEDFDYTELLPDIFDYEEILSIENSNDKKHAFYTAWTRKESFVKALGKGIDEDFKYIPCSDGQHNINLTLLKNNENWQIVSFNLKFDYVGSIAFEELAAITHNIKFQKIPNNLHEIKNMTRLGNK